MHGPPGERSTEELCSFGVVNLDKPPGPSAHEVTGWVRDLAGVDRAAHAGTLDPKVTGCLPILLGDATRLAGVFLDGAKEYIAVLELHGDPPRDFEAVVERFTGPLYQKPPRKSAVVRRLRVREVYDVDVLELRDRQALLRIRCESGTYVRKFCHDLGLALGTGAHMGDLRRSATEPFDDRDLVTIQEFADALAYDRDGVADPPIAIDDVLSPAERALEGISRVTIADSAAREVANGAPVYAPGVIDVDDELRERSLADADVDDDANDDDTVAVDDDNGTVDGDNEDEPPLVACYTPDGAAVCLGRFVGDPDADQGIVVDLERVLV